MIKKKNKIERKLNKSRFSSTQSRKLHITKLYHKYVRFAYTNIRRSQFNKDDAISNDFREYLLFINDFITSNVVLTNVKIDDYTFAKLIDIDKSIK